VTFALEVFLQIRVVLKLDTITIRTNETIRIFEFEEVSLRAIVSSETCCIAARNVTGLTVMGLVLDCCLLLLFQLWLMSFVLGFLLLLELLGRVGSLGFPVVMLVFGVLFLDKPSNVLKLFRGKVQFSLRASNGFLKRRV